MRSEGFPFLSGGLGVALCSPTVGVAFAAVRDDGVWLCFFRSYGTYPKSVLGRYHVVVFDVAGVSFCWHDWQGQWDSSCCGCVVVHFFGVGTAFAACAWIWQMPCAWQVQWIRDGWDCMCCFSHVRRSISCMFVSVLLRNDGRCSILCHLPLLSHFYCGMRSERVFGICALLLWSALEMSGAHGCS